MLSLLPYANAASGVGSFYFILVHSQPDCDFIVIQINKELMISFFFFDNIVASDYILISNCDNFRCRSSSERKGRLMSKFLMMYGIRMLKHMRQTPSKFITMPDSANSW